MSPHLELEYFNKFNCFIGFDITKTYELIYRDEREYVRQGHRDDSLIIDYDASNLKGDLDDLMQKSLDTGVNLIFEMVKDKKVIITKEMKQKAIDEMDLVFYD